MATLSSLASIVPEPSVSKRSNASRISCFCSSERPEARPLPLVRVVPTYSCQNKQSSSVRAKSQQLARRRNCFQCNRRAQFAQPTPPPAPNTPHPTPAHTSDFHPITQTPRTRQPTVARRPTPPCSVPNARSVDATTIHDRRPAPAPPRATPRLAPAPHRTPPRKLHRASPRPARRDPRICARARRCAPQQSTRAIAGIQSHRRARVPPRRAQRAPRDDDGREKREIAIDSRRTHHDVRSGRGAVCGHGTGDVVDVRVGEGGVGLVVIGRKSASDEQNGWGWRIQNRAATGERRGTTRRRRRRRLWRRRARGIRIFSSR